MIKRILATLATLLTVFLSVSPALAASPPSFQLPTSYSDYGSWGWAQGDLSNAVEWQIMQGMSVGVMSPDSTLTRAQIVTMLARAMGNAQLDPTQTSTTVPFPDITAQTNGVGYAYQPLQALLADGVVNPTMYPSGFAPTDPASRAETAALLYRALVYYGGNLGNANTSFSDVSSSGSITVNGATVQASDVLGAAKAGIIKGFPDGTFQPSGDLTRAQAAAMIVRFVVALPGYEQLAMQTPWLTKSNGFMYFPVDAPTSGIDNSVSLIGTSADAGNVAATSAQFQAEPIASWPQIHEWLASQNWVALAEAKLDQTKADYVAGYGLEPWQVGEIVAVAEQYMASVTDSPLLSALQPNAHDGSSGQGAGTFTPVSSLYLQALNNIWENWGSFRIWFTVVGTAGTYPLWLALGKQPDGNWQVGQVMNSPCTNQAIINNGTSLNGCGS